MYALLYMLLLFEIKLFKLTMPTMCYLNEIMFILKMI